MIMDNRKASDIKAILSAFLVKNALYLVMLFLLCVIVAIEPSFIRLQNFYFILTQSSSRIVLALGVASIIVLGYTDLSLGRSVGMAAIVSSSLLQAANYSQRIFPDLPQLPIVVPILIAMLLCALFQVAQGIVVSKLKVAPFIASLGFQLVIYGLQSLYIDELNDSSPIGGFDQKFSRFAQGAIEFENFRIPYLILYAIAAIIIVWFIWNKTKLGRNMYAIGGNVEAATVSGVNVVANIIVIYVIAGLMYGFGGALEGARTGSVTNMLGSGYELDAISACVVGGVSMRGGVGTVPGVATGVLLFQIINYGLVFIGVNPYVQYIVKGMIIILAVAIDSQKYIKRK
ncbi:MAG TPA: galactose/methyl galactoside ABC transporter permease MglC [Rectinemataceae bacterium]|nr:galactose/methyl galactoside ABC transporter permease MglC [Rectinemataceae bacterium]